jgi:hypothetical protein
MPGRRPGSLEALLLLYFLSYLGSVLSTKVATSGTVPGLGRPLTGLEILPASLLVNMTLIYGFIALSGWYRDAGTRRIGRFRVPFPSRYTALSAVGSSLVLCTVPLSYTFIDVSIPFMQLLMRGDILLIAPLVDVMFGRRVRWWSWVALGTVAVALTLAIHQRGTFGLPPLAITAVVLYTVGYFIRLSMMTRVAKSGDPATLRRYFVEEKLLALPLSLVVVVVLSLSGLGSGSDELAWGLVHVWSSPAVWAVVTAGVTLGLVSLFASILLLAPQENSYCVPLERSASLLAGLAATAILHIALGLPAPTGAEIVSALLLVGAIVLLTVAPRRWNSRTRAAARTAAESTRLA